MPFEGTWERAGLKYRVPGAGTCRKPGGKAVVEIIMAVTITREGTELNTKTARRPKQTSVSVEKVFCCCDEPVPLLAFRELGGGEKREKEGQG